MKQSAVNKEFFARLAYLGYSRRGIKAKLLESDMIIDLKEDLLSQRELHYMSHLLGNKTAVEIAEEMNISLRTVESHLDKFKHKLQCDRRIIILCLAGLFSFYDLFQLTWFDVISGTLQLRFHCSPTYVGFLSSAFFWGNAAGIIPIGVFLDNRHVRTVALFLLALTCSTNFIMATSHWFPLLVLMRFFQGLSSAASLLISMRLATTLFPKHTNQAACVIGFFASLGGIFGNWGFGHVFVAHGLESSLFLAGALGWLLWGLLILTFKGVGEAEMITSFDSKPTSGYRRIITAIHCWPNIIAGLYLGFINTPIFILGSLWGVFYFEKCSWSNNITID